MSAHAWGDRICLDQTGLANPTVVKSEDDSIYVLYAALYNHSFRLIHSIDGGDTWSAYVTVAEDTEKRRGIILGGTGIGNGILANKLKGIRAGIIYDEYSAKMSRKHNDANVMALGARTLSIDKAKKLVKIWLDTPFSNEEKHKRRIEKIRKLEE
jgi:ribose 5-phosphate isomerase B